MIIGLGFRNFASKIEKKISGSRETGNGSLDTNDIRRTTGTPFQENPFSVSHCATAIYPFTP